MPAEGLCTRHRTGGQIRISARSGILLLAVQGKEKLLERKRISKKKTKLMRVWGCLAQTSKQPLGLQQRTLEIRGNPQATTCNWRPAFPAAKSLEQDLLHQIDCFSAFSINFGSFSYCFSNLFLQVYLLGPLAFVNSEMSVCPQRISGFVFPDYILQ